MTLQEIMNHLRCNVLRDSALPQLWTDSELLRFVNQAQLEFAIRTHNIVDDTTAEYTTITTEAGLGIYPISDKVVHVSEVGLVEYDTTDPQNPVETNYQQLRSRTRNQLRRRYSKGRPCYYTAQVRSHAIRLDPIPDDVYTIEMVVARKPKRELINEKDVPEIDSEWHLNLCDYAAFRALTNNDPEGANMSTAGEFKGLWDMAIRDCKRQMSVLRASETPRARVNWTGKVR